VCTHRPISRDVEEALGALVPVADDVVVVDQNDGLRDMGECLGGIRALLGTPPRLLL